MKKYIALLRGINVGGHKSIKMETLRNTFSELPFQNVSTYIQSGNIIFNSAESDQKALSDHIAAHIQKHFSFDVPVIVVTPIELKNIIGSNPFADRTTDDAVQPYIAFLSDDANPENLFELEQIDFGKDEWRYGKKCLYISYFDSAANTKLENSLIERKLKVQSTVRNWKTVKKLLELST
ncbi:MAG TPA: DUF1697 domain-containing protein [Flavobacterium sp.]